MSYKNSVSNILKSRSNEAAPHKNIDHLIMQDKQIKQEQKEIERHILFGLDSQLRRCFLERPEGS